MIKIIIGGMNLTCKVTDFLMEGEGWEKFEDLEDSRGNMSKNGEIEALSILLGIISISCLQQSFAFILM